MLQIKGLRFQYPRSTFRLEIDELQFGAAECVAIVGPSGSGKTTLLNLIAGIVVPDQGEIQVDQTVVSSLSDTARRSFRSAEIGFVFQQFELIEYLNLLENILLPYYVSSSLELDRATRQRAIASARSMGLGDKLGRMVRKLSQGEQQRVAICRALVNCPKWILADEPTGNLDPGNKKNTMKRLFQYSRENGATLVVVTHDSGILEGFDRVVDFEKFLSVSDSSVATTADHNSSASSR